MVAPVASFAEIAAMSAAENVGRARAWVAVPLVAALAVMLAGCIKIEDKDAPRGGDAGWLGDLEVGSGLLAFDGDAVVLERGGAKARIAANGDLTIDGTAVAVDATQRQNLVAYHDAARQLRKNAIATGREGAELAKDVVADVVSGLASGNTSEIEQNARRRAEDVKRAAARICEDLAAMQAAQERLAGTLEAFKPFATIDRAALDDCRSDTAPDAALAATGAGSATPPSAGTASEAPAATR
jgi:hypothetical protein